MTIVPAAPPAADPAPGKGVVLYDADCQFCQLSVKTLRRLDWFGRLAFRNGRDVDHLPPSAVPLDPQRLIEEMHVVTSDRQRAFAGFAAFRWIAWRLPLIAAFTPLLYLPGVLWLGNRVYRSIARNRFDLIPCHNGACQVPRKRK